MFSRIRTPRQKQSDPTQSRGIGCLFFLMVCAIACGLLVVNSAIVWSAYNAFQPVGPAFMDDEKFKQGAMLVVPVLLICLQMFIYDLLVDCLPLDKQ